MNRTERFFIDVIASYISDRTPSLPKTVDHAELMRLAYIHKLTPVVYSALSPVKDGLPEDFTDALKSISLPLISSQILRSRAFCEKYESLTKAGVRCAVVKGIALRSLWREGDLRLSSDEDVLVDPSDFDAASRVLLSGGMTEKEEPSPDANVRAVVCPESGLVIELHRALFDGTGKLMVRMSSLFKNSLSHLTELNIDNCKIYTFSPTDHLLYLILHSFKHFISCGFGVRQVADFIIFARKYAGSINTERIISSLRTLRAIGFFNCLLKICDEYFGVPRSELGFASYTPADTNTKNMMEDIISAGAYGNSTLERTHSATMTLASAERGKSRSSAVFALFPSYRIMKRSYPVLAEHKILLPAAWVDRIITKGLRKKKNFSRSETLETGQRRTALLRQYGVIK